MSAQYWQQKKFDELTAGELYGILQLRNDVFVVEQNCVYADTDGKDLKAVQLFCSDGDKVIACARILGKGISYKEVSIGRVCTAAHRRKEGLGRELMKRAIAVCGELYHGEPVRIGAQYYLKEFYESFGFVCEGEVYLEDGIPHIEMLKK